MKATNQPPLSNIKISNGLTLVELLVTLSIAAILLAASAPAFNNIIAQNRVDSAADTLMRAAYLARTESIKRGSRVVTCLSSNGTTCDTTGADALLIFSDSDGSGSPKHASDFIKTFQFDTTSLNITYNRPFLAFNAMGLASGTNGTFTVCGASGKGDVVIVSSLGRARKGRDYDGDGVVEKVPGSPIIC